MATRRVCSTRLPRLRILSIFAPARRRGRRLQIATIPTAEINTLADILSSCVNSNGSYDGDLGLRTALLCCDAVPEALLPAIRLLLL